MKSLEEIKEDIKIYTKQQKDSFKGVEEPWETITLYHGTTSKYLNEILKNGLTPRSLNQKNNFIEVPSNEELVYLSTKWHYWYAYNANQNSLIESLGVERFNKEPIETLWNETSDFPMFITCEVPVELLTLDEDVVYQYNIKKGLKDGSISSPEDITLEMCLEQGTVASMGIISPEYINSITILGNPAFKEYLLDGQYGVDASNWFRGLGMGISDLFELEMIGITEFRNGNEMILVEYPPENNKPVKKMELTENGLSILFEEM